MTWDDDTHTRARHLPKSMKTRKRKVVGLGGILDFGLGFLSSVTKAHMAAGKKDLSLRLPTPFLHRHQCGIPLLGHSAGFLRLLSCAV